MSEKNKRDWKKFKEENEMLEEELNTDELGEEPPVTEDVQQEQSALDHVSYTELEEKLTLSEQTAHENWEKAVRAMAELENVRRRAERDVANAYKYSLEKFITGLLPVLDSLEQALQLAEKHQDQSMYEGLELTMKLFLTALEKHDVQVINPEGQVFDPHEHEAMSMQEVPGTDTNVIIAVIQKGYKLSDRVIRPARVMVAR